MTEPLPRLPESVQEIVDVLGREKTFDFIGRLPQSGTRKWRVCIYIPKRLPSPDHMLVRLLGYEDAVKMCRAFSGMILQPSNCRFLYREHRNRVIWRLNAEDMPVTEIADVVELSTYRVREIIAMEPNQKQEA